MAEIVNINRYTTVTESNLSQVVSKLLECNITKSLQASSASALTNIIRTECIFYGIPLLFVVDGGYRMSPSDARVSYHSSSAVQLYTYLAQSKGLPLVSSMEVKYIINPLSATIRLQDFFNKIQANKVFSGSVLEALLTGDNTFKDLTKYKLPDNQRIISIPKHMVYGLDEAAIPAPYLLCLAGTYNIIGVVGVLNFNDGTKFDFKYEIDPESTKTMTTRGPSAYAKNPLQFLVTKFQRHAMKAYYGTLIPLLPLENYTSEDTVVVQSSDIDARMREVEEMSRKRKEKSTKKEGFKEENEEAIEKSIAEYLAAK